jgi:hypothetical protein
MLPRLRLDLFLGNIVVGLMALLVVAFSIALFDGTRVEKVLGNVNGPMAISIGACSTLVAGFLIGEVLDSLFRVARLPSPVGRFWKQYIRYGLGVAGSPYECYVKHFRITVAARDTPVNALFFQALKRVFSITADQVEKMTDAELRQLQEVLVSYLKQHAKGEALDAVRWHGTFGQFQLRLAFVASIFAVICLGATLGVLAGAPAAYGGGILMSMFLIAWALSYYSGINTASLFTHRAKLLAHAFVAVAPNKSPKPAAAA